MSLDMSRAGSDLKFSNSVLFDWALSTVARSNSKLAVLFHSDFQDIVVSVMFNAPEITLPLSDWTTNVYGGNSLNASSSSVFDLYQDSQWTKLTEFLEQLALMPLFPLLVTLAIVNFRVMALTRALSPYAARLLYYFFGYACESRLQAEAVFETFFLTVLFLTMMIVTFDDDKEEVLEFLNLHLFILFLAIFLVHGWKYSTHYLSFLDTSRKSTSSFLVIGGQALFDFLNLIGFSLRFVLLMARLNIYDGVDDILDSYYVLLIDFDEDEYFVDSLTDLSSLSYFDSDVEDDRSYLLEDESDLSLDIYTLYAVLWGKYVFYLAFILEEFARVGLALFVTYLLVFEINAVNRSYNEDSYLLSKRS